MLFSRVQLSQLKVFVMIDLCTQMAQSSPVFGPVFYNLLVRDVIPLDILLISYHKSKDRVHVTVSISHNMPAADMPSPSWNTNQVEQNDECSEKNVQQIEHFTEMSYIHVGLLFY